MSGWLRFLPPLRAFFGYIGLKCSVPPSFSFQLHRLCSHCNMDLATCEQQQEIVISLASREPRTAHTQRWIHETERLSELAITELPWNNRCLLTEIQPMAINGHTSVARLPSWGSAEVIERSRGRMNVRAGPGIMSGPGII